MEAKVLVILELSLQRAIGNWQ